MFCWHAGDALALTLNFEYIFFTYLLIVSGGNSDMIVRPPRKLKKFRKLINLKTKKKIKFKLNKCLSYICFKAVARVNTNCATGELVKTFNMLSNKGLTFSPFYF